MPEGWLPSVNVTAGICKPSLARFRDALTVEYQETPLAQYTVRYQPDKKHFKAVPEARRFETSYRSMQGWLWELDETLWQLAKRLPEYAPRKKRRNKPMPLQLPLLEDPPVAQE